MYVGQVENLVPNIKAAFVRFGNGRKGYLPISEGENAIYTSGRKGSASLRPGDELLVQVSRDAMKENWRLLPQILILQENIWRLLREIKNRIFREAVQRRDSPGQKMAGV